MKPCIVCAQPAAFRERTHAAAIFCGHACQLAHYTARVGLKTDDQVVGLETSDGQRFELPRSLAVQMKTVANLLEDAGHDAYIPLPPIDRALLGIILRVLRGDMPFTDLDRLDDRTFFSLIRACNWLEYTPMLGFLVTGLGPRLLKVDQATFDAHIGSFKDLLLTACTMLVTPEIDQLLKRLGTRLPDFQIRARELIEVLYTYVHTVSTAFAWAAGSGHVEVVNLLLDTPGRGIDPADYHNKAIRNAAENGHLDVVDRLLQDQRVNPNDDDGVPYNDDEYPAIVLASIRGHVEVVARLLRDPRVIPGIRDSSAVIYASAEGHLDIVKLLLAYRNLAHPEWQVDPAARDNWALIMAARNGHVHVVDFLLKDDSVDPTDFGHTAITQADAYEHEKVVALLEAWYRDHGREVPSNVKRRRLQGRVYK
jgi:hypothetical protein